MLAWPGSSLANFKELAESLVNRRGQRWAPPLPPRGGPSDWGLPSPVVIRFSRPQSSAQRERSAEQVKLCPAPTSRIKGLSLHGGGGVGVGEPRGSHTRPLGRTWWDPAWWRHLSLQSSAPNKPRDEARPLVPLSVRVCRAAVRRKRDDRALRHRDALRECQPQSTLLHPLTDEVLSAPPQRPHQTSPPWRTVLW